MKEDKVVLIPIKENTRNKLILLKEQIRQKYKMNHTPTFDEVILCFLKEKNT